MEGLPYGKGITHGHFAHASHLAVVWRLRRLWHRALVDLGSHHRGRFHAHHVAVRPFPFRQHPLAVLAVAYSFCARQACAHTDVEPTCSFEPEIFPDAIHSNRDWVFLVVYAEYRAACGRFFVPSRLSPHRLVGDRVGGVGRVGNALLLRWSGWCGCLLGHYTSQIAAVVFASAEHRPEYFRI